MLLILLVVMLTGIIAAVLFGTVKVPGKSAYFTPKAELVHIDGKTVIRIQHLDGDVLSLNTSRGTGTAYPVTFFVQTSSARAEVRVSPATRSMIYGPGDMIYIYHTPAGYFLSDTGKDIHPDRDVSPASAGASAYIVIVDRNAGVTIASLGPF
jgi:hypothetical protein